MDSSPILQSQNDKRQYKHVKLPNKLEAIIISDPETDKCSTSLSVNVGSLLDPKEFHGLAHFLEHMLFLGTEKYPNENEYKDYLNKNSGMCNAYTSLTETVFYFQCAKDALFGALDRFSQFFVSPLFTESCTEREMQAVHSEHQKNLLSDAWRTMQLFRNSAKESHPYNTFATGCLETLQKPKIRETLLDFYEKYYSGNIMKLVVYGMEPLETLEKWVCEFFSGVKNKDVVVPIHKELPFDEENLGQFWKILPVKDDDLLEIQWIIELLQPFYLSNPGKYLSHLFGHEGENSLLSLLIDEGLGLELTAGYYDEISLFSRFFIQIKLTKEGLENVPKILELTFAYLKMLKENPPQEYIFEEIKKVKEISFAFKEKESPQSYSVNLCSKMQNFPIHHALKVDYFMEKYEPENILRIINSLKLENMRIYLKSPVVESEANLVEPIYTTKYTFSKLDKNIIDIFNDPKLNLSKSKKKLGLPIKNRFLPQNLEVKTNDASKYPKNVYNTAQSSLFFKQDDIFKTPKGEIYVRVMTLNEGFPQFINYSLAAEIWQDLFYNDLRESLYLAEMANIYTSFFVRSLGIYIKISGFNDSLKNWMEEIIEKLIIFDPTTDEAKFERIRKKKEKNYQNFTKLDPYRMSSDHFVFAMRSVGFFENGDLLKAITKFTFADFRECMKSWLKYVRFEWLAIGNLEVEPMIQLVDFFEEKMKVKGSLLLEKEDTTQIRAVKIKKNSHFSYDFVIPEQKQTNSDVTVLFQTRHSDNSKLLVKILVNYLNAIFFSELRTKQQLGYIVFCFNEEDRGVFSINFEIQSERYPSHAVAQRIFEFIDAQKKEIINLKEEDFQKYKDSVLNNILQKDLSLSKEADRHWGEIITQQMLFDRKEREKESLGQISREEFIQFALKLFWDEKRILEIHSVSQKHHEENKSLKEERKTQNKNITFVESLKKFKNTMEWYPDFYSYYQGK